MHPGDPAGPGRGLGSAESKNLSAAVAPAGTRPARIRVPTPRRGALRTRSTAVTAGSRVRAAPIRPGLERGPGPTAVSQVHTRPGNRGFAGAGPRVRSPAARPAANRRLPSADSGRNFGPGRASLPAAAARAECAPGRGAAAAALAAIESRRLSLANGRARLRRRGRPSQRRLAVLAARGGCRGRTRPALLERQGGSAGPITRAAAWAIPTEAEVMGGASPWRQRTGLNGRGLGAWAWASAGAGSPTHRPAARSPTAGWGLAGALRGVLRRRVAGAEARGENVPSGKGWFGGQCR